MRAAVYSLLFHPIETRLPVLTTTGYHVLSAKLNATCEKVHSSVEEHCAVRWILWILLLLLQSAKDESKFILAELLSKY